jgi:accessory colonization factor AcfC
MKKHFIIFLACILFASLNLLSQDINQLTTDADPNQSKAGGPHFVLSEVLSGYTTFENIEVREFNTLNIDEIKVDFLEKLRKKLGNY